MAPNYRYSTYRSRRPVSGPRRVNRILLVLVGLAIVFFAGRALISGPKKDEGNENANANLNVSLGSLNLNGNVSALRKTVNVDTCTRAVSLASTAENVVALTLDTSGVTSGTRAILSTLKTENIPVVFFATGEWAQKSPDLLKEIAASYPVYNHSFSHPDFTTISADQVDEELNKADLTIREVTGKTTKPFFRPPFGALDKDGKIVKQAQEAGYCTVLWTVDGLDWQESATVDSVVSRILERGAKPGAIILMHAGDEISAGSVAKVITELKAKGYTFVSLESLLAT